MAAEALDLNVQGMTCQNCARSVENALASTPGVTKVTVNLKNAVAAVEYDTDLVKAEVLVNTVRELGYEVLL